MIMFWECFPPPQPLQTGLHEKMRICSTTKCDFPVLNTFIGKDKFQYIFVEWFYNEKKMLWSAICRREIFIGSSLVCSVCVNLAFVQSKRRCKSWINKNGRRCVANQRSSGGFHASAARFHWNHRCFKRWKLWTNIHPTQPRQKTNLFVESLQISTVFK